MTKSEQVPVIKEYTEMLSKKRREWKLLQDYIKSTKEITDDSSESSGSLDDGRYIE